uniref:Putative nuclease HARBI1 n=1 Tax=Scylla olivacea TaxID=85551 RepID=A0A0P4WBW8_SCYOL
MEIILAYFHNRALRRERRLRDHSDPLSVSDIELIAKYRFPRHELILMFEEMEPQLQRRTHHNHTLPTHTQVLLALRFFASGFLQNVTRDTAGLSQASVSRVLEHVFTILSDKSVHEIRMPPTHWDRRRSAYQFYILRNYPRVIGAIDTTHIAIKTPDVDEALYFNHKRYHSLNIQLVSDANGVILSYCSRFPGATPDGAVWDNSNLKLRFDRGEFGDYLLIGDSGYPLDPYLMVPVSNPTTAAEQQYNRAHAQTRVIVEQTVGMLKSRFRCLHSSSGCLQYTPIMCVKIINACLLLHNRCMKCGVPIPDDLPPLPNEELPHVDANLAFHWRGQRTRGIVTRQELIQNFFSNEQRDDDEEEEQEEANVEE